MNDATQDTLRGQRTYHVSDERLRAFARLSPAQRLQWVEQCSAFVRMGQAAKARQTSAPASEQSTRATM